MPVMIRRIGTETRIEIVLYVGTAQREINIALD